MAAGRELSQRANHRDELLACGPGDGVPEWMVTSTRPSTLTPARDLARLCRGWYRSASIRIEGALKLVGRAGAGVPTLLRTLQPRRPRT